MAEVCETVLATSMAELRVKRDAAVLADLVELRLDGVVDLDVAGALAGRRKPVVVTCRAGWEGGRFDGAEETRLTILADAMQLGAEFVDVEWRADRRRLPVVGSRSQIVISHHDFAEVPPDLGDRVSAMRAEGAAIVKVAVMARRLTDCLLLRDATADAGRHVSIAMGAAGQITRLWPAGFGSCWSYAGSAAPGQTAATTLIDRYHVRQTTSATALYGVAGMPLGHSASPAMHNAAFAALGMDAVYMPLETADAGDVLTAARAFGVRGLSVTAPLKRSVAAACDSRDDVSDAIGAVNTVTFDGGWRGSNFDVAGFLAPLDRGPLCRAGDTAVVLGAGGAARAVVMGLVSRGLQVAIAARRRDAATALAAELSVGIADWPPRGDCHLLVNTTSAGSWPRIDDSPIDLRAMRAAVVYDLVYNPAETALLRQARAAGARTIGGLDMLVDQACRQFEHWTSRTAPRGVMYRAAEDFIASVSAAAPAAQSIP